MAEDPAIAKRKLRSGALTCKADRLPFMLTTLPGPCHEKAFRYAIRLWDDIRSATDQ
jgi:hypothetical protein